MRAAAAVSGGVGLREVDTQGDTRAVDITTCARLASSSSSHSPSRTASASGLPYEERCSR